MRTVLDGDAGGTQRVANRVRLGEVAGLARFGAGVQLLRDQGVQHIMLAALAVAVRACGTGPRLGQRIQSQRIQHRPHRDQGAAHLGAGRIAVGTVIQLAQQRVAVANRGEDRRRGAGDVHVVIHRGDEIGGKIIGADPGDLGALGLLGCVVTLFLQLTHKISIPFLAAVPQGALCVGLPVLLVGAMLLVSRRTGRASEAGPRRHLTKRTWVSLGVIALAVPATILCGVYLLGDRKYLFISLLVLLEVMLPFALLFERRGPTARELVLLAVLSALCVAGRAAFSALPQFKPVMAVTIIAGVAFGGETGFLVGAMTMLASNVLFGQGPLTPWQMFSMGIIGFLAGILFRKGLLRRNRGALCVFGALAAILIYGGIMNPASALTWVGELNEKVLLTYYISGLPFDCIQAAATWLFLWFGAEPMLEKLDRVKVKYGVVER